jgi:hypothetical protein
MKTRKRRHRGTGIYEQVKARAARELRDTIADLPELKPLVESSTRKVHVPMPTSMTMLDGMQTPLRFTWTAEGLEVGEPDIVPDALKKYVSNEPPIRVPIGSNPPIFSTSPTYVRHAVAYMNATPPRVWLKQPSLPSGADRVAMLANMTVSRRYLEKYANTEAQHWCTEWLIPRIKRAFVAKLKDSNADGRMVDKARKMRFIVGSTDGKWPIKEPLQWSVDATDNYVNWSRLNETTVRRDWNVYDVNAFYELETNTVVVPNAFLGFYVEGNGAANMATLGSSVGHEMAHAFDHDGVFYDADGALLGRALGEPLSLVQSGQSRVNSAQKDEMAADRIGVDLALEIVRKEGFDETQFREVYAAHWPKYRRKRGDVHAAGTTRTRAAFRRPT